MAQRQFSSSDTSVWQDRYGNGSQGVGTNPAAEYIPVTGTSGNSTLNGSWVGTYPILIHQTQRTGAGNWELNYSTGGNGSVMNLRYPLCNTYETGAQAVVMYPYSNVNISGTLGPAAWNGTVGGIYAILCNGTVTISGSLAGTGVGFRGGGSAGNNSHGSQGEGSAGAGAYGNQAANGNGGGAALQAWEGPGGAGGGAYAANGTDGSGGGYLPSHGNGGTAVGIAGLTTLFLGGGGGSGGNSSNSQSSGSGGIGGGIVLIIAKTITVTGSITSSGTTGNVPNGSSSGGGGGAGGAILLKGQTLILGTTLLNAALGSGRGGSGSGGPGGSGSVGRIHADYSKSCMGTTSPTINLTEDKTLADISNFFAFF